MKAVATFGVFGDMHYAPDDEGELCCPASLGKIQRTLQGFRDRGLDCAVVLGDAIAGGRGEEQDLGCVQAVREFLAAFPGVIRFVLGNHDLKGFTKADVVASYGDWLPAPHYACDHDGVRFVVLDGNCHEDGSDFSRGEFEWEDAWISGDQVEWLERTLADSRDLPVIVFCHENLDDRGTSEERDPYVVGNAAEVRAVIERNGNVKAVIQGHYHAGMHTVIGGIPYLMVTSTVTGPDEDRTAGAVVSLFEDGRLVVEGFGRQESWQWPER